MKNYIGWVDFIIIIALLSASVLGRICFYKSLFFFFSSFLKVWYTYTPTPPNTHTHTHHAREREIEREGGKGGTSSDDITSPFIAAFLRNGSLPVQDHFALRPQKRGGLLGTGTGGKGTKEWQLDRGYRPKKTGETVDRRQNNGNVKAVSPRQNCCAWAESEGQCPLHCCWGTTRSERSPTFAAQLHLTTHDLFWANLKVQLHFPPLDLLISPTSHSPLSQKRTRLCCQQHTRVSIYQPPHKGTGVRDPPGRLCWYAGLQMLD